MKRALSLILLIALFPAASAHTPHMAPYVPAYGSQSAPYIAPGFGFYAARPAYPFPNGPALPLFAPRSEREQGYAAGYDEGYQAGLAGQADGLLAYTAFQLETAARFDERPQSRYYFLHFRPTKISVRSVLTAYDIAYRDGMDAGFRDGFLGAPYRGEPYVDEPGISLAPAFFRTGRPANIRGAGAPSMNRQDGPGFIEGGYRAPQRSTGQGGRFIPMPQGRSAGPQAAY